VQNLYEFEVTTIDGQKQSLDSYRGCVILIVNVASQCGFTPQYAGLENLYRKYHEQGFAILGFPCDQFRHQEPGSESEINAFCQRMYDVTFPLFAKISVNGPKVHPLYQYLKRARRGVLGTKAIKWNFTKFLVDRGGNVVRRYAPITGPGQIEKVLQRLL
jgi:glutathione peroxidase